MKTIFIPISRGLIVRNILRNRYFKMLAERNDVRIIILFHNIYNLSVPQYLIKDFAKENVILEFIPNVTKKRLERLYRSAVKFLVYTKSSEIFAENKIGTQRKMGKPIVILIDYIYSILSQLPVLKKLARKLEPHIFLDKILAIYFDKYKPDLVFSTAILSNLDIDVLKHAKKRKIKTISMPKSWDNLEKMFFRVESDTFLIQNRAMKEEVVKYQAIDEKKIKIVGFPQFDIYKQSGILWPKAEYCARKNFDPGLPILFLGSEGIWSRGDEVIFKNIIAKRDKNILPNCNILVRPHFSNVCQNRYEEFRRLKNVFVDDNFRRSVFFADGWDPSLEDHVDFTNSLYYCNMMITFASTLALDAAYFDKPTIAIGYGVQFGESAKHAAKSMYDTVHYESVKNTGAIKIAFSEDELIKDIIHVLGNADFKQKERSVLKENFCGIDDGESGKRIMEIILDHLNK